MYGKFDLHYPGEAVLASIFGISCEAVLANNVRYVSVSCAATGNNLCITLQVT